MRRLLLAASAFAFATPAIAAEAAGPWHEKGKEMLGTAIGIPSVTTRPDEVKKLVVWLKGEFEKGGFTDVSVKDYDGTQGLIVRWKADGKPKKKPILLIGHMDVVDAKPEDWSRDPFKMIEEDGYLYGRGSTDMKSGIVAITHSLLRLKAEGFKPKRDIVVFFSGDEEVDGRGADLASTEWRKLVGTTPLVAIGGVTPERAMQAFAAGADIASAVTDITLNPDPEGRIREWLRVTQ